MTKKIIYKELPDILPIFPLPGVIILPNGNLPLNIFEPRYINMVEDALATKHRLIGMIQPLKINTEAHLDETKKYQKVGCAGRIVSFTETDDGRYLIELKGLIRFNIISEIESEKKYRECEISFDKFHDDLLDQKENLKFSDLELIFKDLKNLFEKRGFIINWKALENQSLNETINALAMASPFTLEEKQVLLETKNINARKSKIADILTTYNFDQFNNTTIQ